MRDEHPPGPETETGRAPAARLRRREPSPRGRALHACHPPSDSNDSLEMGEIRFTRSGPEVNRLAALLTRFPDECHRHVTNDLQ